jgi:tetratricopeptide (TPR) repeat protein
MSRITVCLVTFLLLHTLPVHADEAMDYFNLARKGSITRKKIELFTKALQLNPRLAAAYEQRGLLYYFQGKYDKVIQDYHTYLDLAPEKAEAYRMLGLGYLKNGDYELAIPHFTRAIELEPQHPAGYAYRAEANLLRGKDEEAILDSTAAVELRGDTRARSEAYKTRARAYRKMGLMDLAYADTASLEELRGAGLIGIIVLAFVLVFGLKLKPPWKDD